MRKKILWVFLIIVCGYTVMAQTIPTYDLELVKSFPIGSEEGEIGTLQGMQGYSGRTDPAILYSNKRGLIIEDYVNSRFLILGENYSVEDTIPYDYESQGGYLSEDSDFYLIRYFSLKSIEIHTLEERLARITVYRAEPALSELYDFRSFAYYEGVLFVHDKDLGLWSIVEPGLDQEENRKKLRDEYGTQEYMRERWGESGEVRIDGSQRLFINDELVTRDFQQWSTYRGFRLNADYRYVGDDRFGNTYWVASSIVVIYPPESNHPWYFKFSLSEVSSSPTVDYETGDIYFLGTPQREEIGLYKIARTTWEQQERE